MDVFRLSIYFTAAGICFILSATIILAQAILKVNPIFSRIGLYLFFTNLVALAHAVFQVPGLEPWSREILILQRMASLVSGFPLISLVTVIKKDFLKRPVIAFIYAQLAVLLLIAFVDLAGDCGWLYLDPPPRVHPSPFYKAVFIPFGFYALAMSIVILVLVARKADRENRRLVHLLVAGLLVNLLAGAWAYAVMLASRDPFHDEPFVFNPAVLILAFFIFLFIVQFVKLRLKYLKSGGWPATETEPSGEAGPDRKLFDRLAAVTAERRLYADPDLTVGKIADAVGRSRNVVSRVINRYSDSNFNGFINAYRVDEMKKRLAAPVLPASIAALGGEAGFRSKASMNRIFKRATDLSPQAYRARAQSDR